MKKIYTFAFLLFVSLFVKAQTNLVLNGGVENWTDATTLDDWTTENNVSQNTTDVVEGSSSATLTIGADDIRPKILAKVPMEMNVEYNVSYRFKYVDSNFGGTHPVSLRIIRSGSATTISSNRFASNNNWIEVSTTFTPDQTGDYDLSISTATFDSEGFTVLIDDVKVVEPVEEIVNISDANFKNALLNHSPAIDTNGDGEIQVSEATAFNGTLSLSNKNISDLTGIETFVNIQGLHCTNNPLGTINISSNINLISLSCGSANLNSIDLSNNLNLESLFLQSNNLTHIDLSKNTKLLNINVGSNNLTNIDISNATNLRDLSCYQNDLAGIDLTNNTELINLFCSNNTNISEINLSNNSKLLYLNCRNNNLTDLNLSNNILLERLNFTSNKIESIDLSNHTALTTLDCRYNNLTSLNIANGNNTLLTNVNTESNLLLCIQVDDVSYSENNVNWTKDSPTSYSIDCSNFSSPLINIPDANFKTALLNHNPVVDLNQDGEIQVNEAKFVRYLNLDDKNISDLTGIEFFVNINSLSVTTNQLTNLDVSNNLDLENLYCARNILTNLNISNNVKLQNLHIYDNQITDIDTSKNIELTEFYCSNNLITHLDLLNNIKLRVLYCRDNIFTMIDLSNNPELTHFTCSGISSLNIANGNNTNIVRFDTTYSNDLTCIKVDDEDYSTANWTNIDPHTSFSNDCSLVSKLIINPSYGAGTVNTSPTPPNNGLYLNNTEVTLTAVPSELYSFVEWTGDITGTENPITVSMDTDKRITAVYKKVKNVLSLINTEGTIITNPNSVNGIYDDGTYVELTAIPNEGYLLSHWNGYPGVYANGNPISHQINYDITFTANYVKAYTLNLNSENGITDITHLSGINSENKYEENSSVKIEAIAEYGYQFDGWSGDASGTTNPLTITMDADKSITAVFSAIQHALTTNATNGNITRDPDTPASGTYDYGTDIVLTAVPDVGYQFDGWSGDLSGNTNPLTITIDSDKIVTAIFSKIQHTLTTNNTNGSITRDPDISLSGTYDYGTDVILTAVPDAGYQFDGWSGDLSGNTNPSTITIDSDKTVTAIFSEIDNTPKNVKITAIIEGDCPTGSLAPRVVELYVTGTVDVTNIKLQFQSASNDFWVTNNSIGTGVYTDTYLYVVNSETAFDQEFPNIRTNTNTTVGTIISSVEGGDKLRLVDSSRGDQVIDIFGYDGENGENTSWNFVNSYAKRKSTASQNPSFDESEWDITPKNSLLFKGTCWGEEIINNIVKLGDITLSNDEIIFDDKKFTLYPNPVKKILTVESKSSISIKEIKIVDLLGKEILQTKEISINVSHLPKGIYLMEITSENNRVGVKKFIKE